MKSPLGIHWRVVVEYFDDEEVQLRACWVDDDGNEIDTMEPRTLRCGDAMDVHYPIERA
jgi:hypothetical protein